MRKIFLLPVVLLTASTGWAQASSYFDAAQAYNRLMIERNSNALTRVGAFKVQGTPYLFGERQTADVYAKGETGLKETISYNTFNQQLEIQLAGQNDLIKKELAGIDSFRLIKGAETPYKEDLLFINAAHAGGTEKTFLQVMRKGARFSLYKAYRTTLEISTTNYVQADLRVFELNYDYYYTDAQRAGMKKIKKSADQVRKEFKAVKDLSSFAALESFAQNPDEALVALFNLLNN